MKNNRDEKLPPHEVRIGGLSSSVEGVEDGATSVEGSGARARCSTSIDQHDVEQEKKDGVSGAKKAALRRQTDCFDEEGMVQDKTVPVSSSLFVRSGSRVE